MSNNAVMQPKEKDYSNDFDYPSLNRKDLMNMDTINTKDFPKGSIKNRLITNRDWSMNLYTLDIDKAYPPRINPYNNKVDFINKVDDIDKAKPRGLRPLMNPCFINRARDIDKAFPAKVREFPQLHLNPLEPKYILPSVKPAPPPTPPKFIRDSISIADIEGARSKKLSEATRGRNYMYDKEEGLDNHPKKPYVRKQFYDSFDYRDTRKKWESSRNTNPLDPDYGEAYGRFVEKSKPMAIRYLPNKGYDYLKNNDIIGSTTNTTYPIIMFNSLNRNLSASDISGAQADTKVRCISTARCTDPLAPRYQYLGRTENKVYTSLPIFDKEPIKRRMPNPPVNYSQDMKNNNMNVQNYYSENQNLRPSQSCSNIHIPQQINQNSQYLEVQSQPNQSFNQMNEPAYNQVLSQPNLEPNLNQNNQIPNDNNPNIQNQNSQNINQIQNIPNQEIPNSSQGIQNPNQSQINPQMNPQINQPQQIENNVQIPNSEIRKQSNEYENGESDINRMLQIKKKGLSRSCENIMANYPVKNTNLIDNTNLNGNCQQPIKEEEKNPIEDIANQFEEKVNFDKNLYKRPEKYYGLKRGEGLFSAEMNPLNNRYNQMKIASELPNGSFGRVDLNQNFVSKFNKDMKGLNYKGKDTYYSEFKNIPPYEYQLDYFLKDNSYECLKK